MNPTMLTNPEQERDDDAPAGNTSSGGVNTLLGLVLVGIIAFAGWKFFGPTPSMAGWNRDWESGVAQSKSTGKPAVVLFTADWCGPCKQLKSETLADGKVQATLASGFTPVVVDLTDRGGPNDLVARDFAVRGIPTVILFDRNGREVKRTHGMGPEEFVGWLKTR